MGVDADKFERAPFILKPDGFGIRHMQYVLMFCGITIAYGMRTVLNVGIIAMISDNPTSDSIPTYPEWSSKKNIMLSSFFWGYICLQVGAGQLAKNYGAKHFLAMAIAIGSIFMILIPFFGAQFGYKGVIFCRIIQGLTQGFLLPCIHSLLSSWAPLTERTKWGSFVYAGTPLGNMFAMPITGLIAASAVGWPAAFYLYGSLGVVWSIVWLIFGSSNPSKHKSISELEKKYIEAEVFTERKQEVVTPWKSIATSIPFYAILVTQCGQNWGFWTLLTEIPSFMDNILKFKIASNSFLSALPYLVMSLLSFVMSPIASLLITRGITSIGTSRKIFNSIGLFIPAIALISLTFVSNTQKEITVAILVIAVGFNAGQYSGFNVNHIDISPTHAATLMGIANSLSNIFALLSPLAVDVVKIATGYEETDKALWNIVFCIAAGIFIMVGTIFNIFGTGEVQPWNNVTPRIQKTKEKTFTSEV